jgi:CDGSH-type Zn-finger protein
MATTKASNKAKAIKLIISALLITSINSTSAYAAGRATPLPTNTVLSGNGVPSTAIGIDGDFYIDIKSLNMYGPKVKNKWPLPISLKGPAGPIGPSGVDGKSGTSGSASSTVGATGPVGPAGPAGPSGPAGATGAQGPAGSGSAGATGATGATGPAGPSNVQSIPISNWTLATNTPAGVSESTGFGTLEAGKKYSWCSCGYSQKQPFCDGSHKGTSFAPMVFQASESTKVYFCGI